MLFGRAYRCFFFAPLFSQRFIFVENYSAENGLPRLGLSLIPAFARKRACEKVV